jgi:hypothetical protein
MLKDTKSLGNSKASACESRGFVHKKKKVRFLTYLQALMIVWGLRRGVPGREKSVGTPLSN